MSGRWATWDVFRELERQGLIMYGQMTAGSWIYIGTQGILQGTYETFGAMARRHFGGSLRGRIVLTGGLGGMGGAQPLAATMNDGVCLAVEVDPGRGQRRLETRYLDRSTASLDEAVGWGGEAEGTAPPGAGRRRHRRVRHPGLRSRVHPAPVLRGQGAVPVGGAVGRRGRPASH